METLKYRLRVTIGKLPEGEVFTLKGRDVFHGELSGVTISSEEVILSDKFEEIKTGKKARRRNKV